MVGVGADVGRSVGGNGVSVGVGGVGVGGTGVSVGGAGVGVDNSTTSVGGSGVGSGPQADTTRQSNSSTVAHDLQLAERILCIIFPSSRQTNRRFKAYAVASMAGALRKSAQVGELAGRLSEQGAVGLRLRRSFLSETSP